MSNTNEALNAEKKFKTSVEEAQEYIENFDILETINNVGNDEVFTPVKVCQQILDILPMEVWSNPNYKWLNPCDKNGVFLREIALRLDEGLKKWEPDEELRRKHILQKMLFSIGLTRFTSQVSRRTVYYCSQANKKFDGKVDLEGHSINGYAIGNGAWFDTPEGNILTPKTEHSFVKGKCIFCGTNEKEKDGKPGRYSDPGQLEHYAYEFIHDSDIKTQIQKRFFGGKNMKFDIIIGNPPYQLSDGGAQASAKPLYHLFIENAIQLSPKYISMIIPSRWTLGGKGLDQFRNNMLKDTSLRILHDFIDSKECFPNNDIKGGVCYFLWDRDNKGKCEIITHENKTITSRDKRYLLENGHDVFIRRNEAVTILSKIRAKNEISFSSIVSARKPFGLPSNFRDYSKNQKGKATIKIYAQKQQGYVSHDQLLKNHEWVNMYKLLIPEAIGKGDMRVDVLKPIIAGPNTCCTETYLVIGPYNDLATIENINSYVQTKFFHFLLGVKKITQHTTSKVYELIPMQDFSLKWTDEELFKKYNLTEEEINTIDSIVFGGASYGDKV